MNDHGSRGRTRPPRTPPKISTAAPRVVGVLLLAFGLLASAPAAAGFKIFIGGGSAHSGHGFGLQHRSPGHHFHGHKFGHGHRKHFGGHGFVRHGFGVHRGQHAGAFHRRGHVYHGHHHRLQHGRYHHFSRPPVHSLGRHYYTPHRSQLHLYYRSHD